MQAYSRPVKMVDLYKKFSFNPSTVKNIDRDSLEIFVEEVEEEERKLRQTKKRIIKEDKKRQK